MGLKDSYQIIPSEYEEILDSARSPEEVAQELGYGKALWVAERNPEAWVIGSDTIVTIEGKQLGKAADEAEAREMLKMLAGMTSTVTTSIVLMKLSITPGNERIIKHFIGYEEVIVHFKPYDENSVEQYLSSGDWHDKAGAYGIQSGAHTLIDSIEGNYDTIVGLPTHTLAEFLAQIGVQAKTVDLEPPVPQRTAA